MKKTLATLLAVGLCFGLTGCGTVYEDTNGEDDYSLQTITEENIVNLDLGASGFAHEKTEAFGVTSEEYKSKNFNGVERLYLTNFIAKSDVNIYVGHFNLKKGNIRLVCVLDGKIIKDIPVDTFAEIIRFEDIKGTFEIMIAGESANFSLNIDPEYI